MTPLIIYHAECTDGLGAALAAKWSSGSKIADVSEAEFVAAKPQWDILNQYKGPLEGRKLYLLDYSFKRPVLEKLLTICESVTIIDHHKTAEEDLRGLPGCCFDMSHSGAVLSWMYFTDNEPVPELFQYIESRDLWKFDLPYSPEVSTAIQSYGHDIDDPVWEDMVNDWRTWYPRLIAEGEAINRFRRAMISVVSKTAEEVKIGEQKVLAVNAQYLASEIGAWLKKMSPVVCIWYWDGQRQLYNMSLRSDETVDVSAIAAKFGGGGHAQAAGFTCKELPWK